MGRASKAALDRTDRQILAALEKDARASLAKIGRDVGLSGPGVGERLRWLEEAGVIRGYRAQIDAEKAGFPIRGYLRLKTVASQYPRVLARLRETPGILEASHVTGEESFVIRFAVPSMGDLEALIACLSPFGETATSLVLSTAIERGLFE
jgi:Lrp/AsnC family transcriptional regulator, leucine-responsive regulatory protein